MLTQQISAKMRGMAQTYAGKLLWDFEARTTIRIIPDNRIFTDPYGKREGLLFLPGVDKDTTVSEEMVEQAILMERVSEPLMKCDPFATLTMENVLEDFEAEAETLLRSFEVSVDQLGVQVYMTPVKLWIDWSPSEVEFIAYFLAGKEGPDGKGIESETVRSEEVQPGDGSDLRAEAAPDGTPEEADSGS